MYDEMRNRSLANRLQLSETFDDIQSDWKRVGFRKR
jgi:hypothetical protein